MKIEYWLSAVREPDLHRYLMGLPDCFPAVNEIHAN